MSIHDNGEAMAVTHPSLYDAPDYAARVLKAVDDIAKKWPAFTEEHLTASNGWPHQDLFLRIGDLATNGDRTARDIVALLRERNLLEVAQLANAIPAGYRMTPRAREALAFSPTYTIEQVRETMDAVEKWLDLSPDYPDVIHPTALFNELLAWAAKLSGMSRKLPPY